MTSIVQDAEPMTVRAIVQALIGESDSRAAQLGQRLAAWREGYTAGFLAGVEVGRGAEGCERDADWQAIARPISRIDPAAERRRWALRGEPRTRQEFSQPHPGDYPGGAA